MCWVDIEARRARTAAPADVFHFHELAVEDALVGHPLIRRSRRYDGCLYLILHGIAAGDGAARLRHAGRRLLRRPQLPRDRAPRAVALDRRRAARVCLRAHRPVRRRPGRPVPSHRRSAWSITTARRWTSSRTGSRRSSRRCSIGPRANPLKELLALKRDVASLRRVVAAAARRRRPPGPPRVSADLRGDGLPVP